MSPTSVMPPPPYNPPFWYGSFSGLWVYYLVDLTKLNAALPFNGALFRAYDFGNGKGLVNINLMNYAGHSGQNNPQAYIDILKPINPSSSTFPPSLGVEPSNECEFNIVCYPTARSTQTPIGLSIADYIAGNDHTKTLGNYRVFVPCDDRIAVYWGTNNYGENKVMTHPFLYNVPSLNNTGATSTKGQTAWQFIVPGTVQEAFTFNFNSNANPPIFSCNPFMFGVNFDCSNVPSTPCNPSEIIDYSIVPDVVVGQRPVGSRRNLFGSFKAYDLVANKPTVAQLSIGNSTHPLAPLMGSMISPASKPVAAQVFHSQPVIAESGQYYVDL